MLFKKRTNLVKPEDSENKVKNIEAICNDLGYRVNILMSSIENHKDCFKDLSNNKRITASNFKGLLLNFINKIEEIKDFPDDKIQEYSNSMIKRIIIILDLMFVKDKFTNNFTFEGATNILYQQIHLPTQLLIKSLHIEDKEMIAAFKKVNDKYYGKKNTVRL